MITIPISHHPECIVIVKNAVTYILCCKLEISLYNFKKVVKWLNWASPNGLETPAPAQFLGGANEMGTGSKAYFTVNLTEGKYVWISEIPDPESHNMLKRFTIEN